MWHVGCILYGTYSWPPECPRGGVVQISHIHVVWNSWVLQIRSTVRFESCLGSIFLQGIVFPPFLLFWWNPCWYYVRDIFADFYFFKGNKPTGSDWLSSSFCFSLGLSAFYIEFCSFQTSMCTLLALCQFVLYPPLHFDNCIHKVRCLVRSLFNDHE